MYKDGRFQYKCDYSKQRYARASCQFLSGGPIDQVVIEEFFTVLNPAQIDALKKVTAKHHEKDVARLEYEARRAERRYNLVDPENRLIAATLEQKWELALRELEQAKARLEAAGREAQTRIEIASDLRDAFADIGKRMPEVWNRLSVKAKKELIRTLVEGVNLLRRADGTVQLRLAWRGGLVTERIVRIPVHSLRNSDIERKIAEKIRQLADEGLDDQRIAARLNRDGFMPCRGDAFTHRIVFKLRRRYKINLDLDRVRRGRLAEGYALREMARIIGVHPSWIRHRICEGRIEVGKDPKYGLYLFPRTADAVERMRKLKDRRLRHASFREVH